MEISPYLSFNGDCAAAFTFYQQCLGGKIITMQTHGESPMKDHVAPGWHDKVIHARLEVGNSVVMGSDTPPPHYAPPQGTYVSISVPSVADGQRIFSALGEDGKVSMPFAKTFWSPGFGILIDRFGVPWMVNSEQA